MFAEFTKIACAICGPLLVISIVSKGLLAIVPALVALGIVMTLFGAAKGFAQADAR